MNCVCYNSGLHNSNFKTWSQCPLLGAPVANNYVPLSPWSSRLESPSFLLQLYFPGKHTPGSLCGCSVYTILLCFPRCFSVCHWSRAMACCFKSIRMYILSESWQVSGSWIHAIVVEEAGRSFLPAEACGRACSHHWGPGIRRRDRHQQQS